MILKKIHVISHKELRSHCIYITIPIQTIICLHSSFIV